MNWFSKFKEKAVNLLYTLLAILLFLGIILSIVGIAYMYKVLVIDVYNWNILTLIPVVIIIVLVLIGLDIV